MSFLKKKRILFYPVSVLHIYGFFSKAPSNNYKKTELCCWFNKYPYTHFCQALCIIYQPTKKGKNCQIGIKRFNTTCPFASDNEFKYSI